MRVINSIPFAETTELKEFASEHFLRTAKDKGIAQDDPADKRKVLFRFDKLPVEWQIQLTERYGDPKEHTLKQQFKASLKPSQQAIEFYRGYRLQDGRGLPESHIIEYAKAAMYLEGILVDSCLLTVVSKVIAEEGVKLPVNERKLRRKLKEYTGGTSGTLAPAGRNYECLVSKKFGNNNSEKINDEAGKWLIAQYGMPVKMTTQQLWIRYNSEAVKRGWALLKSEEAILHYLYRDGNEQLWYGSRHGWLKAREKFGYTLKTILPSHRDALWYSDGTGLNYIGQTDGKWLKQHSMYCIIDCFSEVILGCHVSETENYVAQYKAAKMAIQFAGHKPYEWRYDNQGGHKRAESQEFFSRLAHLHFATQPYNGKSKTIENIFSRFQQNVMRQDWFFSGQNRTAKRENSKANMEFVMENKESLPSIEEIKNALAQRVNEWNNAQHPTSGMTRIETYRASVNPKAVPVTQLDMVDMFWLTTAQPITYRTNGITMSVRNEKYEYEVLKDGMPDAEFRAKYIGEKFFVKHDPEDMSYVMLYVDSPAGLQFVAMAESRIEVHRAIADHEPGEMELIKGLLQVRKDEMARMKRATREVQQEAEVTPEQLVMGTSYGELLKQESTGTGRISIYGDDDEPEEYKVIE